MVVSVVLRVNTEVETTELIPDLNMYGEQFQGAEMIQENSCKVLRRVFTRFFM